MKRILAVLVLMPGLVLFAAGGTKRALAVFIGDYPAESGWNRLSSGNDRILVGGMLERLGFDAENILCLSDAEATCDAILDALDRLVACTKKGDQVYVHFCCHGQQITDQDGDEALANSKDRYDEAIVPYDAYVAYGWHGYKGERHLRDDVLNGYFSMLQEAVGRHGCVLVVYDACHSGDMDRADNERTAHPYRGTFDAFEQPYTGSGTAVRIRPVTWMSISACKDFQTNFEVEAEGLRYGRLSYAISRCLHGGITFEALVAALQEQFRLLPMPAGKVQTLQFRAADGMNKKRLFVDE